MLLDASVMTFNQPIAWNWLVQFCILATALLIGNVLRTKIPFLRKSLIPSALIGGLLLLVFKAIPGGKELINKPVMEIVTYHALGLGFVALALKNNKIESKSTPMKVIETGALTASTYVIQGIVGLIVSILFFYFGRKMFYAAGLLLPMGYGQGPGQALNFGKIFTGWAAQQGIDFPGADFGLSIAATGFIVGSVVGVIYMNILRRKGVLSRKKLAEAQVNKLEDYDTKVRLSYLQTNSLYNEKMPVDEKRVLKNLNEYLIKQDISWGDRKKVWDILKINIWDPESVEGWADHFFKVSVDVEIEFDTVWDLTGFLYNVEKKMIDNREDRILYKIQSVSYDVVSNDEPQITDISMIAYYYHDERFDEQSECGNDPDKPNVGDNQQDDNISDSDWFLQKIFKNF